jgi:tRNA A-37 threonylcarbamoyl transferase component Bud32
MNEETLFHLAREKSPDQRGEFLDKACAGDAELRRRVETLLRADEAAGSFLARPAVEGSTDGNEAANEPDLPAMSASSAANTATLAPDETTSAVRAPAAKVRYFGDYELLEEIAQGGMGVVWKARQSNLHRDVALKMIRAGTLATSAEVARFHREAEAAANLQHPNIVAIHEVGEHEGRHYFSMDLVEGRDLGAIVAEGPLAPQRAARCVKIIAEAIHFAHQRGTLHRDLKPQNILIDGADQPRITDFGLAKTATDSQLTQSGVIMGSPSYMPPEQAAGQLGEIGPASDVYSLGAMLYELLAGRPPFRGDTAMATLHDVMETEPTALRRLKADVPPDLETICLKCLEKSPAARYPTAQALADELDRFLKGEPIMARPASQVRKVVTWCRRHPGPLAALAALALVALAFGVFYLLEENAFLRAQHAALQAREEELLKAYAFLRARLPAPPQGSEDEVHLGYKYLVTPASKLKEELEEAHPLGRSSGWRHRALTTWGDTVAIWIGLLGIFAYVAVSRWSRGLPLRFSELESGQHYWRHFQPLGEWKRNFAIVAGIIEFAGGVAYLVAVVQAYVWEGEPIRFGQFAILYLLFYWGYAILHVVVRDFRLVNYGTAAASITMALPQANKELDTASRAVYEKARAAMEKWDQEAAIQTYRDAGLAKRDAMAVVMKLGKRMRAERPDRFAYPPLSLSNMSWKGIFFCALIEAALFAVVWYRDPPSQPIAAVLPFAYCFLFGTGIMAFTRVKGFGTRILLLAPGAVVMLASEIALRSLQGQLHTSELYMLGHFFGTFELYVLGFIFGMALMASGLVGEAGRALRKKLSQPGGEKP